MICNAKEKLRVMKDAVAAEHGTLMSMDMDDPEVQLRLDNNKRLRKVLEGDNAEAIERELYSMTQDLKDPLTNDFKLGMTGFDNKLTVWQGKNKRTEEVKSVNYVETATQDYIEVATYPSTKPNSVRTYKFAVGQDTGTGSQVSKGKYQVRVNGIGEYSDKLRLRRKDLGSNDSAKGRRASRKVDDYVHGNINSMKSVFNTLLGDSSSEYAKYGRDLLGSFSPKFFKDMELFIEEVESQSEGSTGVSRIDVFKSKLPRQDRSSMDSAEVYLHEVIHTMTRFALDGETAKSKSLYRELSKLVEEAKESIEPEDLYPDNATQTEKDIINTRYDYIFNNRRGPSIGDQEFLAFALTNPKLMEKLKELGSKEEDMPVMDRIVDFFKKLVRIMLGELSFDNKDKNLYDRAYNLAFRLGEINIQAEKEVSKIQKASDYVMDMVNAVDNYIAEQTQHVKDKVVGEGTVIEKYPRNGSRLEKAKHIMKLIKYGTTTEEGRSLAGVMLTSFGLDPRTSTREFFGSFFERSSTEKVMDWLGLAAGKIDTMRESEVNTSRALIMEAFDGELKEFEDEAMTKYFMDTNIGVLYKEHGLDKVKEFLSDPNSVDKELKRLKKELSRLDKGQYNWLSTQAHGLGYYMATHKANIAQNTNSYNIANGRMSTKGVTYNEEVEKVVSEIASLTALKYTKGNDVDVVVDLIERKPEGVKTVINMYEGFKTSTRKTMFKDDPVHMVEGYTTEQFDDNIELKVLPEKEAAKLKSLGYKKVKDLGRTNKEGEALSLYASEGYGVRERLRGAAKLVSMSAKGTSLAETIYGYSLNPELELSVENKILEGKRERMAKEMEAGTFNVEKEDNMMALLNGEGAVVGYRFTMDKKTKKEVLKQDVRATEVLPRSKGHLIDKMYTLEQNERVLEFIKEDMEENWKGGVTGGPKGLTDYIVIRENSKEEEYRELFKMLPKSFKDYANSREDKSIAVPAELYNSIFGYQHISIVNAKWAKKMPEFVVKYTGMLEELWMDLVKVVKGNILMKMPIVLIGNIMSNIVLRIVNGAEPISLIKDYFESFRDVRQYIKNNREIIKLEAEIATGNEELLTNPNKELRKEIKKKEQLVVRYKASNEKNPVKELVDAGLYQAIVEDVEVSTIEGKTVWDKMGNSVLGVLPDSAAKGVKTGADILYFNQRTKWFKVNQEIMQLSDLIARDVQNKTAKAMERKQLQGRAELPLWWRKEKGLDKKARLTKAEDIAEFEERSKEVRMYALLENYVNYSRPSGRTEEYLNRLGVLMFTKYAKRIQKVIMDQGTNHPIKTFLALLVDNSLMNISTIQDAHILSKEWHMDSHGPGNFYPLYSPLEHIENFVTPALIKESTWDFLPI